MSQSVRKLTLLAVALICVGYAPMTGAQEKDRYSEFMGLAAQSLSQGNLDDTRVTYASAIGATLEPQEQLSAALCLILTFEEAGVLREAALREWYKARLPSEPVRHIVESAVREYYVRFHSQEAIEGVPEALRGFDIDAPARPASLFSGALNTSLKVGEGVTMRKEPAYAEGVRAGLDVFSSITNTPALPATFSSQILRPSGATAVAVDYGGPIAVRMAELVKPGATLEDWSRASHRDIGALLHVVSIDAPSAPQRHHDLRSLEILAAPTLAQAQANQFVYDAPRAMMMSGTAMEDIVRKMHALAYDELVGGAEELFRQDKLAEARVMYAKALGSEPQTQTLSRAATGIVLTFRDATGFNWNACKTWAQANIATADGRLRIELAVGELYYRNQDYDSAIKALEPVSEREGHVAESASLVLALCYIGKGDREQAILRLNKIATESASDEVSAKAMFLIGWAHLQAQHHAAAKAAFDRLVRTHPGSQFAKKAADLSERLNAHIK